MSKGRDLRLVATRPLGVVQRPVGALDQIRKFRRLFALKPANADTDGHGKRFSTKTEFLLAELLPQPLHGLGYMHFRDVGHHQEELIAAYSSANVRSPGVGFQDLAELLQDFVAGSMTVGVVDLLEAVQVGVHHP